MYTALRQAILAQKEAAKYAPPTAQQWAEGYDAALGWVLFRLDRVVAEGWYSDRFGFHRHPDEWALNITRRAHQRCRRACVEVSNKTV